MRPHIKLKKRSDANFNNSTFLLVDPLALNETNAGPFTESAGVGGPYSELAGWQEWAQESWNAGANKRKVEDLGYLYGLIESRVPEQLILPPKVYVAGHDNTALTAPSTFKKALVTLSAAGSLRKIATRYTASAGAKTFSVKGFLRIPTGSTITVEVREDSAGKPTGTLLDTRTLTGTNDTPCPRWEHLWTGTETIPVAGFVWVILTAVTGSSYIAQDETSSYTALTTMTYNGTVWSTPGTNPRYAIWNGPLQLATNGGGPITGMYAVGDNIWVARGATITYYGGGAWATMSPAYAAAVLSVAEFNGNTYVALSGVNYRLITGSGTPVAGADGGSQATLFYASGGGYLWRANGALLYYTGDGTTWTQVETNGRTIQAMSELEGDLYYLTTQGLYWVAPGDFVVEVMHFDKTDTQPRFSMTNFEGALWFVANEDVYRMDSGRSVNSFHPFRNTNVKAYSKLSPVSVAQSQSTLYLLLADATGSTTQYGSYVMNWSPEGWHHTAYVGNAPSTAAYQGALFYSRTEERLYVSLNDWNYALYQASRPLNPYFDGSAAFANFGWFETPQFYGNRYLIDKHFDLVTLRAENLAADSGSAGSLVEVYYKGDGVGAWTSLGTIDVAAETLRWTGADLAGKWIQLGFLVWANADATTPRILATVLKYQSLLTDRARWTLPLNVDGSQDVDSWTYTNSPNESAADRVSDTVARIVALRESTEPLIFEDIDGTQYEVWMISYNRAITKYDYHAGDSEVEYAAVYTVILEQLEAGTYN